MRCYSIYNGYNVQSSSVFFFSIIKRCVFTHREVCLTRIEIDQAFSIYFGFATFVDAAIHRRLCFALLIPSDARVL